jgi:hypothetical protein
MGFKVEGAWAKSSGVSFIVVETKFHDRGYARSWMSHEHGHATQFTMSVASSSIVLENAPIYAQRAQIFVMALTAPLNKSHPVCQL